MRASTGIIVSLLLHTVVTGGAAQAQDARTLQPHAGAWERLLAAEDARAALPAQLRTLLEALRAPQPELRAIAVRALGRLERPDMVPRIAPLLQDAQPSVRAAAAHALGQAVLRGDAETARGPLERALRAERDDAVRAALAETIGRIRQTDAAAARASAALLATQLHGSPTAALGALRGLYLLTRQPSGRAGVVTAAAVIRPLAAGNETSLTARRVRRLAIMTMVAAGAHDAALLSEALSDADTLVRREAAAGLNTLNDTTAVRALLLRVLADPVPAVRYEGVRTFARRFAARDGCATLQQAARDGNPHVALLAIDALRTACAQSTDVTAQLDSLAGTVADAGWHRAAHALVALSTRDAARTRTLLPRFTAHPSLFARTYAALAAGVARDTSALLQLAGDAHANVRTTAVEWVQRVLGRAADSVFLAQLRLDDSQLLMATAAALDSLRVEGAAAALLDALDRITAQQRETSRDARVALLGSARALGSAALAPRLRKYLTDFDPVVADSAASVLQAWTGTRPSPRPSPPPALRLPTFAETAALADVVFVFELENGTSFDVRLFPFGAPTNAARFARLARQHYFDGLTFHRVAANFVVQGGSPGANEYSGDGPFTRDELGAPNWRGTVGLSTRGRDTGDAQIFINTVDNVRLDHEYTVFGEVVRGMDVVDALLEGAVIRRVSERPAAR